MADDTTAARRIADRRHATEERAARHLTEKFGLPDDLIQDLIREVGSDRAKLDAAARRLTDS
jgi:hypothetical protein